MRHFSGALDETQLVTLVLSYDSRRQSYRPPPAGGNLSGSGVGAGAGSGGGAPLIVKLRYDESVGALRAYVQAHIGEGLAFDLRCAYAPGALADPARSVREAGLTPNATLFLRFR